MWGVNKEPRARWERAGAAYAGTAAKRNVPQIMALLRYFESPTECLLILHL